MTRSELNKRYFEWMYRLVYDKRCARGASYRKLLRHLHRTNFFYTIPMDGNRAEDGMDLRYRFAYERSYDGPMVATYLDDHPCSVLEMMIALSIRCEEHIMDDPDAGNRTGQWFWNMLVSLGLEFMDDKRFDEVYVNRVVSRFLNREYGRNGQGGLFTVRYCEKDMRTVEIWCQMCWYLDEFME